MTEEELLWCLHWVWDVWPYVLSNSLLACGIVGLSETLPGIVETLVSFFENEAATYLEHSPCNASMGNATVEEWEGKNHSFKARGYTPKVHI